jgi:hypothetical protein
MFIQQNKIAMKTLKLTVLTACFATFIGCVNSDEYETPNVAGNCNDLAVTKQVQDITSTSTATYTQYPETEDIIEAYVTSSDEGGNFFKSISLVSTDNTVGFSMPIDAYNLYTKFEPGRKVFVNMKNRYIVKENGSTIIGSLYNNDTPEITTDDEVGRISGVEYQNIVSRSCSKVNEDDIVKTLTVNEAKNDQYLNMLIDLNNVQFTDASLGKKYFDASLNDLGGATNHLITNEFGQTIILRISSFSTFASKSVLPKSGKIRGVLTKFGSDYQFMVRTENDMQLTNDRLTIDMSPPIGGTAISYLGTFTEPFTSYTTTNQQIFPKYINDAVVGSRYWQRKVFGGNTYIQMSSFGGTPEVNRSLFIVPVDMTAANNFSFKTLSGFYNGACLKVYYSTNYVPGTNIGSATLVDITSSFTINVGPTSGYATTFTNSGVYAIPASLTGNGFFIFEYNGNGSGGVTTTMQVDDITVN